MAGGPLDTTGLVTLLDHQGRRQSDERFDELASRLAPSDLRDMYRAMVVTRAFDNSAMALQRQGELGLWVQSLGQEGIQAGSGKALRASDYVFPSYREHVVAYQRGLDLPQMLRLFRGLEHGPWDPEEIGFHLYTLVIGAHTLHATGYAMGMDRDGRVGSGTGDDGAVICYLGDGATSQGDFNEALTFAAVTNAPIVFLIQNNQWAISEPTTRQSRIPLVHRADGFGIPSVRVDGNDPIAGYAVTSWALEHARSGNGPVLLEALTYRMGAHTSSDDPTKYRERAQEDYWRERDPIARLESYLTETGELPDDFVAEIEAEGKELADRARTLVRSWPAPPAASMFEHVYAHPHAAVETERAWFERYESSFTDTEAAR